MSGFGLENLPYGVFRHGSAPPRVGVAYEDAVVDLAPLGLAPELDAPTLGPFLAAGPATWARVRAALRARLEAGSAPLLPLADVALELPFVPGDYVDFYASLEHATTVGRLLRPDAEPLLPNWRHLPVGYHGRAGSVAVSETPVVRPCGQLGPGSYGPTERLDFELELAFVAGPGVPRGERIAAGAFAEHVFGFLLLNDWSARDLQRWEYRPLGPFLGKSFLTSVSPWVVPLPALEPFRVAGPAQEPEPLPYLRAPGSWALDVALEAELNGQVVARTNAAGLYWSPPQMLAHATVNGASVRPGDLFATGTISGGAPESRGCLLERTADGAQPLRLPDGSARTYLEDGDEVVLRGRAGSSVSFGEVRGRVAPART